MIFSHPCVKKNDEEHYNFFSPRRASLTSPTGRERELDEGVVGEAYEAKAASKQIFVMCSVDVDAKLETNDIFPLARQTLRALVP